MAAAKSVLVFGGRGAIRDVHMPRIIALPMSTNKCQQRLTAARRLLTAAASMLESLPESLPHIMEQRMLMSHTGSSRGVEHGSGEVGVGFR